ncbi:DNA mismatch repair protein MutS [Halopenitus persicus]|uniref:DNA mismatch repair protein MutS n=1 Tax=Halopenitus persicus TaxID=1048396 RepID=A0A1H3DZV2_9EURY|nr:DNA mismatch repair protein MutS [Halopenitus persicus]SDX72002.1 DNA mismatch repair protein MutS [Halopenitus persicus]
MSTADPTTVTGLPPSIAAARDDLTPMLSQYADLCAAHEDAIVLFQVGDFYEAFCEAAEEVARVCEVTLTKREDSTGSYPMAGIPIDNATSYLERLLEADYRVAIADQTEDAAAASGLVDRAVTQVITPGTVVDEDLLTDRTTNYVAALTRETEAAEDGRGGRDVYGLAAVDVATGECLATSGDRDTVAEELDRLAPAELVRGPGTRPPAANDASGEGRAPNDDDEPEDDEPDDDDAAADGDASADDVPEPVGTDARWMETVLSDDRFAPRAARDRLEPYLSAPEERFATEAELRAAGAVLAYAEYTQGDDGPLEYVSRIRRYDPRRHLRLDAAAQRSLELFENRGPGAGDTLFDVIDETSCALGRRRLERWLRRPLIEPDRIRSRHDAVEWLVDEPIVRETVADGLTGAYDLERLVSRISRGRANARDLRSLETTLAVVPDLRDALSAGNDSTASTEADSAAPCDHLRDLRERLDPLPEIRELIDEAIAVDPPQEITDGDVIRDGYDAELDDLRATEREGREWVAELEARERERTGIDSLTVGHTQVHGYYIEVTDPNLDAVPDDYHRRQTLKNSERFYTPELKEREDEIVGASERADALEYELFTDVRATVAAAADRLQALADALAELDALVSLATVALEGEYVRPTIVDPSTVDGTDDPRDETGDPYDETDDPYDGPDGGGSDGDRIGIAIEGGRHPVVERRGEFVPNDVDLERGDLALITGPNMSGKSTYMRQVALAVVLAQMGSFVPAQAARIPIVDRVFTRIGASDDIAGGQSTFMREMSELTEVLHDATADSLVLLDEVGRGTATTDGRAIACAAAEFIVDEIGATTLFATHYHELTELAERRDRVRNLHFTATREDGEVTFLHRVAPGASSSSYGIEVAALAGVPPAVVDRARERIEPSADADASRDGPTGDAPDAIGDDAHDRAVGEATLRDFLAAADDADPDDRSTHHDRIDRTAPTDRPDDRDADPDRETRDRTGPVDVELAAAIRSLDIATMTPMEALNTLHDLQRELDR